MLHNLFCQTTDCDNLAFWGDERIGFWCERHYRELTALIEQKLAGPDPLTPAQRAVYQVLREREREQRRAWYVLESE